MAHFLLFLLLSFSLSSLSNFAISSSQLRVGYYSETCPRAEIIVREVMRRAKAREPRSVASVMRLQFHDCFVNVRFTSLKLLVLSLFLKEKNVCDLINIFYLGL